LVKKKKIVRSSAKQQPTEEEKDWERLMDHKDTATRSLTALSQLMPAIAAEDEAARDLRDHANGFYEEIDKLAKGKSMLEVTDRALEETNSIIADAKRIVGRDPYLTRTHEFVAAGNNPVYPDVLFALRSILQSLDRFRAKIAEEAQANAEIVSELNTILVAIELIEEGEEAISKEMLLRKLGQPPNKQWMFTDEFHNSTFNLERFKGVGPPIVKNEKRVQLALGSGE
jgi:hypothetical protein